MSRLLLGPATVPAGKGVPLMSKELSALEIAKQSVDPYAGEEVFARLARGTVADITPEDDVVMRWHGLYRQRPPESGLFTLRLRLPNGAVTAGQASVVAGIAGRAGVGRIDLTTRQNVELHSLALADLAAILAELRSAGLTTLGVCGDAVRGIVGCPAAGLDPEEILDTRPTVDALTAAFLGNRDYGNLPRKLKIAVCGCARHCVPTEINDVGLEAARDAEGTLGYTLLVGGGLSASPVFAQPIGWIEVGEAVEVVSAIASLFREHGNRENRARARMKHLLAAWGLDRFRAELEARLGRALRPATTGAHAGSGHDHLGVLAQSEPDRRLVGVPVPAGVLSAEQLLLLAELATEYGRGRLRVTPTQNVLLADIAESDVEAVLTALAACGLPVSESRWAGHTIVCTGREFCNKAMAETKANALRLLDTLEEMLPGAPVRLRISGCPNGCGHHRLGEIGLQGSGVKGEKGLEERFDVWVRCGSAGDAPAFGERVLSRVRPEDLASVVSEQAGRGRLTRAAKGAILGNVD